MKANERLLEYIKEHDGKDDWEPLHFNTKELTKKVAKGFTLNDLIVKCLFMSYWNASLTSDGEWYCREGKDRSVIDIWRHVKFFHPKTSLAQVMRGLYEIYDDNKRTIVGHVCKEIGHRVFNLRCHKSDYEFFGDANDEFELTFPQWGDVLIKKGGGVNDK